MIYKGINRCDYCFAPIEPNSVCPKCGLSKEKYDPEPGMLPLGTVLADKYIIGKSLGRGGFGATYLAYSIERAARVAIKEFFPAGIAVRSADGYGIELVSGDVIDIFQTGAKKFYSEAQILSTFGDNKNIVSVYEFFYANDTVYYSMEFLEGIDLAGYIGKKGGRITEGETITVLYEAAEALATVHNAGILHRDISPDNIYICPDGSVKLIDFGAAKQVIGEKSQSLQVILKEGFAPLEQYQKSGGQGSWTDIYALGATAFYCLTGRVPEDAMTRLSNPYLDYSGSLGISPDFAAVIDMCMSPRVENRYKTGFDVISALAGMLDRSIPLDKYTQTLQARLASRSTEEASSDGVVNASAVLELSKGHHVTGRANRDMTGSFNRRRNVVEAPAAVQRPSAPMQPSAPQPQQVSYNKPVAAKGTNDFPPLALMIASAALAGVSLILPIIFNLL